MPWFVSMLIICLVTFAAAHLLSEKIIARISRSKGRSRDFGLRDQREQQLYDEIAHWERKQE